MALTKYDAYYNQIVDTLESIKTEFEYPNLSGCYTHWFLESYFNYSASNIQEYIIDGSGDNGIDAAIYDEELDKLTIIQTKFPASTRTTMSEVGQDELNATIRGVDALISRATPISPNPNFIDLKKRLTDKFISEVEIIVLTFNTGAPSNESMLKDYCKRSEEETGTKFTYEIFNKQKISNLFEKINRINSTQIKLKCKWQQKAYDLAEREIDSYICVINGRELCKSVEDELLVIFDENIRLLEANSPINAEIRRTASTFNVDSSDMFYFYNNGVSFICDEAISSINDSSIKLKGASIVNGCQTVNSLIDLYQDDLLSEDVDILVRIVTIKDYEQRANITRYLNSQNPVKESYFISNHAIIRDLQKTLLDHNYYLERQINESKYKQEYGENIPKEMIILKLDTTIQHYVGYWINSNAHLAKSGKGALFNPNKIDEILSEISAEKVIESYNVYAQVSKIITKYRKFRRNEENTEFSSFLGITNDDLKPIIDDYLYLNTSDILLLNSVRNLKEKFNQDIDIANTEDINKLILNSIDITKEIIKSKTGSASTLTRSKSIFNENTEKIEFLTELSLS